MRADELPSAFRACINDLLGREAGAFFQAFERPHLRALRLNPRAGLNGMAVKPALALMGPANMERARAMADMYISVPVPWQSGAYYIKDGRMPGTSLMHLMGLYYIQEPSAMAAAAALDVSAGMHVLDLCAAPGGKSSQLASALAGRGLLVANEPIPSRARMLSSNIERQGFSNVVVTCEYPDKLAASWGGSFDAILVDAPCSGEGMFRRDEGAIREWTPDAPIRCHERQLDILESAHALLRSGGRMVYSTCTFNRTENEDTINAFLQRHPDMAAEDFSLCGLGASKAGMLRIWPHMADGEGHFVCRMHKAPAAGAPSPRSARPKPPAGKRRAKQSGALPDAAGELARLERTVPLPELTGRPELFGAKLSLLPEGCPPLEGIHILRAGLELAECGRSHTEPAYALCRALVPVSGALEVDAAGAAALIRGEQLTLEAADGWTFACWQGLPICAVKVSGNIAKSHYPRGLKPLGNIAEESQ